MQLVLYTISDSDNVINKTLGSGLSFNIALKADTNIINPVIKLVSLTGINYLDYNYAEITELNRFYFVSSVKSLNASLWELTLETDVLETYKTEILAGTYRFKRNIKTGDYLNVDIESNVKRNVQLFESNKELEEVKTLIISTLGA